MRDFDPGSWNRPFSCYERAIAQKDASIAALESSDEMRIGRATLVILEQTEYARLERWKDSVAELYAVDTDPLAIGDDRDYYPTIPDALEAAVARVKGEDHASEETE